MMYHLVSVFSSLSSVIMEIMLFVLAWCDTYGIFRKTISIHPDVHRQSCCTCFCNGCVVKLRWIFHKVLSCVQLFRLFFEIFVMHFTYMCVNYINTYHVIRNSMSLLWYLSLETLSIICEIQHHMKHACLHHFLSQVNRYFFRMFITSKPQPV